MLKVFDYHCNNCDQVHPDLIVDPAEPQKCPDCKKTMTKLMAAPRAVDRLRPFQPFWSDTFQRRINDREDLRVMRDEAKASGLTCVGHRKQKPDKAAIRHNYEND